MRVSKKIKDITAPSQSPSKKTFEEGKGKRKWVVEDHEVTVSDEQPLIKKKGKRVVEIPPSPST